MKSETTITGIEGEYLKLADGREWKVEDPFNAPFVLPHLTVGTQVETEDFGIDTYIKVLPSGEKLAASPK